MIVPNGIHAILFDLDETLRYSRPSDEHTFFDFAVQLGLDDSVEKRHGAMRWAHEYWAQSAALMQDIQTYQDEEEFFWTNYARRHLISFGCVEDQAQRLAPTIHRLMRERHKPEDYVPAEVPETLQALKAAGIRLGVVSNRMKPYREELEKLGLGEYFNCFVAAGEVSAWKPEAKIFLHALEQLGVQALNCIYVGDNYYADAIGARGAGLHPVLLDAEGVFPDVDCEVIRSFAELTKFVPVITGSC